MKSWKFRIIGTFVLGVGILILWVILNSNPANTSDNPDAPVSETQ
jgi:hypothetical protein